MRIIVHADDAGICKGITDRIFEAYHLGCLNRVSIIPNGEAFEYAIEKIKENRNLECSIHINLVEGKALSRPEVIPMLVDPSGRFRKTFLTLWLTHLLGFRIKKCLEEQVGIELHAQVARVKEALPGRKIIIDSHRYLHIIPFLFRIILKHREQWNVESIRVIREHFFIGGLMFQGSLFLLLSNLAKHLVLNWFSARCMRIQKPCPIPHPDWFIGVLYSGRMLPGIVKRVMKAILNKDQADTSTVELLFHPGPADLADASIWDNAPRYRKFYFSEKRAQELDTLISSEFIEYIVGFQGRNYE